MSPTAIRRYSPDPEFFLAGTQGQNADPPRSRILSIHISCLLHLVHIAGEKSFGRGEQGGEGERGSKGRFWRKTARCTGLECGARLEFHAGLGVARQGGSLQRWSAKGE